MHRQVTAVANRLSLRPPQRRSLEILDRVVELVPPSKTTDRAAALAAIQQEFAGVTDFERDFPSLCFALATGVGKTRLMGAFISYLRLAHGIRNFFVLAPNLTIYNKLIADFTPNTPKYVFRGVAEFATDPPTIITGDNYDQTLLDIPTSCRVNIFNISKINSEVRGGRSPRIKRLSEYIGDSYFAYLANLTNLYTIVPLRTADSRTLVEQSIGRGLRLPFVVKTGISSLDRLNIIAHDRFQEIVDDCNKGDSPLRLTTVEIEPEDLERH